MTLQWIEGFETHKDNTSLQRKYATMTGTETEKAGRVHGNALGPNSTVLVSPAFSGTSNTAILGFGFYLASHASGLNSTNTSGFHVELGGSGQIYVSPESTSGSGVRFNVKRGSTTLASSSYFPFAAWVYVEFKVEVLNSGGSYELRVDGVSEASGSALQTADTGSDGWDNWATRWASGLSNLVRIDDIYVLDSSGTTNNDFLGACIVEGIVPDAEGAAADWGVQGFADNSQNINDLTTNDTRYNKSDTNGNQDLYSFGNLAEIDGTVYGVQLGAQLGMADVGSRVVKTQYRDPDTTVSDLTSHTVNSTNYDEFIDVLEVNPNGSTTWTISDLDDGQFGVEVVS